MRKGVLTHRPRSGVAAIMARVHGARSSAIGVARGAGVPGGQGTSQRMGCRLRRCACVWLRWRPLCNGLISIGHAPGAGHHQRPRLAEITHGLPRSLQPHTRSRCKLAQGCATLRRCKGLRSRKQCQMHFTLWPHSDAPCGLQTSADGLTMRRGAMGPNARGASQQQLQGRGDHGHIVPGVGLNRRQWGASGSTHTSARHANTMSPRYPP